MKAKTTSEPVTPTLGHTGQSQSPASGTKQTSSLRWGTSEPIVTMLLELQLVEGERHLHGDEQRWHFSPGEPQGCVERGGLKQKVTRLLFLNKHFRYCKLTFPRLSGWKIG